MNRNMDYTQFLEYCVSNGYTGTMEEIQEAYNNYVEKNSNTNNYTDLLEFFVENGIQLNSDQISALQEKVKYQVLPGFKQSADMSEANKAIDDAENILADKGVTQSSGPQIFKAIFRILDIWWNIGSILTLPLCITIVGIIPHLIQRALVWAAQYGQEAVARKQITDVIAKLNQIKGKEKDPKKIQKINECIAKLKKSQSKLSK